MPGDIQVREKLRKQEGNLTKQSHSNERVNLEPTAPPKLEEGQPGVMRSPLSSPVVVQHMPANGMEQGYDK